MTYVLGARSLQRLAGVHPDLVRVVHRAISISDIDFTVLEGRRTLARQKELVAAGASRTLNSRHLTGHAVDLAPLLGAKISWDWPVYKRLAPIIKQAAKLEGVPITWGGHWLRFADGPHWELPRSRYP